MPTILLGRRKQVSVFCLVGVVRRRGTPLEAKTCLTAVCLLMALVQFDYFVVQHLKVPTFTFWLKVVSHVFFYLWVLMTVEVVLPLFGGRSALHTIELEKAKNL